MRKLLKRLFTFCIVLAAMMFLGLSACKSGDGEQTDAEGTTEETTEQASVDQTQESEPIKIGAIFSVTGRYSRLGLPEQKALTMEVEKLNAAGGINGRTIEVIIEDDNSSEEQTNSAFQKLVQQDQVVAIIGPTATGTTMAIKQLAERNEMLLISCAAGEAIVDPVSPWVFKVAPKDSDAVRRIYEDCNSKGISTVGIITSTDGFGQQGKTQLNALAEEYGITIAADETYSSDVTDLTPQLSNIKAAGVQAVINWNASPAQVIVVQNMAQLNMEVPLYQSHGFANIEYAISCGEAANKVQIIFPASRILTPEQLPEDDPQKEVCTTFSNDYSNMYEETVSTFAGHAYDSFHILAQAIEAVGTDTAAIKAHIETMSNFIGTAGIFNFSPEDHNGLDKDCFQMYTIVDEAFQPILE